MCSIAANEGTDGLFGRNSRLSLSTIPDGSSQTLLAGERRSRVNRAAVWCGVDTAAEIVPPDSIQFGPVFVLGSAGRPINGLAEADEIGFSSEHPGGANFAFADGSLRFLSENMDQTVYRQLAHRRDGKPAGAP